ncbi:DUF2834 domain-containing protein [Chondrinema litorale]|uniref:DUF2834 domain-containing protein n=1 Tax=Chondrinema litorale TaxID=2994555 RepID=UPI002543558A|nr:DUF2834 domain-containing protein [Chondrinema litorale]UZR98610.1 DUF2834 domain-containing protein [Chondrinema litorale]
MKLQNLFLILTILGAIIPMSQFYQFLITSGLDFQLFVDQLFANYISTFFALDLIISSIAFMVFVVIDSKRIQLSSFWVYIFLNLMLGLSVALPFYLYKRE